ncbi:MAG: hypothetical protein FK734_06110 [Asgard group archaeon]|nr:hypothetical protein [Asgard group archaeon]
MDMCTLDTHENFYEIRQKAIKSSEGKQLGNVTDVSFDKDLNIHSFILGGQFWDRFRKRLGFIHDTEYSITANHIEKFTRRNIHLSVSKKHFKENVQEAAITTAVHTYTDLRRKTIVDMDGKLIGKIVNLIVLPCGQVSFVVSCLNPGTPGIPKGLGSKWDLLLPIVDIETISEKNIKLNVRIDTLEKTLNHHLLDRKAADEYLNSLKEKDLAAKRALVRAYDGFHMK